MPLIEGERIRCRCGAFVVVSESDAFHEGKACPEFLELMESMGAQNLGVREAAVYDAKKIVLTGDFGCCPCGRRLLTSDAVCDCDLSVDTKRSN